MKDNKDIKKEINAITLRINKDTWELFKSIIPRTITLNKAIINLIEKEIKRKSESK
jgi:hypothetical protein